MSGKTRNKSLFNNTGAGWFFDDTAPLPGSEKKDRKKQRQSKKTNSPVRANSNPGIPDMKRGTRVYELARYYRMRNREFLEILSQLGVEAKSHMSSIVIEGQQTIHAHFSEHLPNPDDKKDKPRTMIRRRKRVPVKKNNQKDS